ncbi:MAG TPA: hypothetical protein VLS89_11020 [Candidatus Nanopelagicales bacterium]|nr:hypothetical protein [Candidatus Nanopelagicales bacterium]
MDTRLRVFTAIPTVALLGCGSAETFNGPEGAGPPPGSSTAAPQCVQVDPSIAGPDGACGVFVSSALGSDEHPGTPEQPVRTLAKAFTLALESEGRVYACAEVFEEAAEVPAGVGLWGGLDCADGWAYTGVTEKTRIAPGVAGVIALRFLAGEGSSSVADVRAEAVSGAAPGESSIAALVEPGVEVVIERSELYAGDGAAGAEGERGGGADAPERAADGVDGIDGGNACGASVIPGAAAVVSVCDGVETIGGKGGNGRVTYGEDGEDGQPIPPQNPQQLGLGGYGENGIYDQCNSGQVGHAGRDGDHGLGALGPGRITIAGWEGVKGQDGADGLIGQGGGGGGGSRGPLYSECGAGQLKGGASGGSGGSGGCGGKGAKGGGSGGASIGLVCLSGEVTIRDTSITTNIGGEGGRGGLWQGGGYGGYGGARGLGPPGGGADGGCSAGAGGKGGNGGLGGGGLGGPTLGIAHVTGIATVTERVVFSLGRAGRGGAGGSPFVTLPGTAGEDGLQANVHEFTMP